MVQITTDAMNTQQHRRYLVDIVTGNRSGYWVEILHHEADGTIAYALHVPNERSDTPLLPTDWDDIRGQMAAHAGSAAAADTLPKHDDRRTWGGFFVPSDILLKL